MNTMKFESQLGQFESQLALLSAALVQNNPNELVAASAELQSMLVRFSKELMPFAKGIQGNKLAQWRVKKIAVALSAVRQGLLRQSVQVERALATLMPTSQNNTYAPSSGSYGRQPYGSAGRQSGEFRALSA
ncbi:hypothetical protein [Rhodoferax sp.]|uniref:hypothetical protein n=1 Tax=Rhodoferax sp. TaxID=50421 RepID=UPI002623EFFE|nr:hypothetical protein [Rhodoferax sp.]MDD2808703.1 hypothetical protein [Rhodoferax sp.]